MKKPSKKFVSEVKERFHPMLKSLWNENMDDAKNLTTFEINGETMIVMNKEGFGKLMEFVIRSTLMLEPSLAKMAKEFEKKSKTKGGKK